jgi:hypothetical protein
VTHTSHILLHLPDHRILYTGLSRTEADKAAAAGRAAGYHVTTQAAPVTGSRRSIWHYTIVGITEAA